MILDELAELTRKRVALAKEELSPEKAHAIAAGIAELEKENGGFTFPFEQALKKPGLSVISEVKKASPSKGVIAEDFPYLAIAESYEAAGADCISCLTEPDRFKGSDRYLEEITDTVNIPVLRKDFTVDTYMIDQAKIFGASAVLLIAAILTDEELKSFFGYADALGLSCIFEAHDEEEVRRCLAAGARIVGVNNRNLKDFTVDMENSIRLRPLVPKDVIYVSESGISTPEDVRKLYENGTDAVLVGEMLMRSSDKAGLIKAMKNSGK